MRLQSERQNLALKYNIFIYLKKKRLNANDERCGCAAVNVQRLRSAVSSEGETDRGDCRKSSCDKFPPGSSASSAPVRPLTVSEPPRGLRGGNTHSPGAGLPQKRSHFDTCRCVVATCVALSQPFELQASFWMN